jgi:hypothetical protein
VAGLVGAEVELDGGVKPLFPQSSDVGGIGGGAGTPPRRTIFGRGNDLIGDGGEAEGFGGGDSTLDGKLFGGHRRLLFGGLGRDTRYGDTRYKIWSGTATEVSAVSFFHYIIIFREKQDFPTNYPRPSLTKIPLFFPHPQNLLHMGNEIRGIVCVAGLAPDKRSFKRGFQKEDFGNEQKME